jgi:hypothetical protein
MRVRFLILLALALGAWAPAAQADQPVAAVRVATCETGSVTYVARMRPVPGAARMALRINLLEKTVGDERFHRVSADKLDVWRRSEPGAAAFKFKQKVDGLRRAAIYRAAVDYRWVDEAGQEIRTAHERSAACKQPGGLPNLRVAGIEVKRGEAEDTAVYRVQIANRGGSTAHRVGVLLRVDGEVVDEVEVIEVLEPGEVRTLSFSGPQCRRHLRVVVDPKDLIPETRERDNIRSPACL